MRTHAFSHLNFIGRIQDTFIYLGRICRSFCKRVMPFNLICQCTQMIAEIAKHSQMLSLLSDYKTKLLIDIRNKNVNAENTGEKVVSASQLVKSPDSHASDPCSRLGGSSWLCFGIYFISEFNEMWEEKFLLAPSCVKSGKLAVRGWTLLQSTWPCSIYEDILQSSTKSSVVHPSWSQYKRKNRVTLTMKRIEAGRQFPMIKQLH